uniref:C2 domain-containing protein n=1 Tax=Opuntia streptacantha TaxID=393608 RepID=A0A7C9DW77_OPUST
MAVAKSSSCPSLKCKLQVVGAKNVKTKHKGSLFIRCYLCAGNNTRTQLNSREMNTSSCRNADFLFWDDDFSLECNGTEDSVSALKQGNIIFELRFRKTTPLFGKMRASQVLARAEVPWKTVFEAPKMEIQTWVVMTPKKLEEDDAKPPALQIAMKMEYPAVLSMEEVRKRRRSERLRQGDECGCCRSGYGGCSSCVDSELLFVAAAFEAF